MKTTGFYPTLEAYEQDEHENFIVYNPDKGWREATDYETWLASQDDSEERAAHERYLKSQA